MPVHFRNREHHFWIHQRQLSFDDQLLADEIVRSRAVQAAIDHLESFLAPDRRPSVAVLVVILNEPVTRHLRIELQGTTGLLALIRDRVSRNLIIYLPDYRHTESHFLQVPMAMITGVADEAEPASTWTRPTATPSSSGIVG